ncbi:hypothetical protein FVER53590_01443 [Fusarium verticillioides]|nr:hypothetical protein FVER53590_01443 [Fusarium verticillioides]
MQIPTIINLTKQQTSLLEYVKSLQQATKLYGTNVVRVDIIRNWNASDPQRFMIQEHNHGSPCCKQQFYSGDSVSSLIHFMILGAQVTNARHYHSYKRSVSSSLSPDRVVASSEDDNAAASTLDPGFFKSLTDKRTTRDGNPPKKRGPKPNSKPALTRRQELNRQAQRTHRERKELYIKALEDEVLRLKEVFSNVSLDRERLADENKRLRDTLAQAGLQHSSPHVAGSATSGSVNTSSPPLTSRSTAPSVGSPMNLPVAVNQGSTTGQPHGMPQPLYRGNPGLEQAGIDFVLTLERPCMTHIQFMVERASEPEGEPCGHALMASCPPDPAPETRPGLPFGKTHIPLDGDTNQKTWEVPKADLATLLDLSKSIDLDGEVTPIMSWGMLMSHPRANELEVVDFRKLSEELVRKVRCYGFGAVMEEFEVRDAIDSVFSGKDSMMGE